MKPATLLLVASTVVGSTLSGIAQSHTDPYRPIGELNVNEYYLRSGTKAQVDWQIIFPTSIPDILERGEGGTVTTSEELRVQVRVAGSSFGLDGASPVSLGITVGGSTTQLFHGTPKDIRADAIVFDQVVPAHTTIDFSGLGELEGVPTEAQSTQTGSSNIISLAAGERVPDFATVLDQGVLECYLTCYLGNANNGHGNNLDGVDSSNPGESTGTADSTEIVANGDDEIRVAYVGPREMIYTFELGDGIVDYQDVLVVVSYERVESTVSP